MNQKEVQQQLKQNVEALVGAVQGGETPEALVLARKILTDLVVLQALADAREAVNESLQQAAVKVEQLADLAPAKAESAPKVEDAPVLSVPEVRVVPIPEGPPKRVLADVVGGDKKQSVAEKLAANAPSQLSFNDQLLWTKSLFRGQKDDFDRVYRMALDQGSAPMARQFCTEVVAPDYGWKLDSEAVQRLFAHFDKVMPAS